MEISEMRDWVEGTGSGVTVFDRPRHEHGARVVGSAGPGPHGPVAHLEHYSLADRSASRVPGEFATIADAVTALLAAADVKVPRFRAGERVTFTSDLPGAFSQYVNQAGTVQGGQVNPPGTLAASDPAVRVYYVSLDNGIRVTCSAAQLRGIPGPDAALNQGHFWVPGGDRDKP